MEGSYPGKLRIWDGWATAIVQERPPFHQAHDMAGPHNPADFASRLYACEAMSPPPRPARSGERMEPYSLQWFLNIESQRHGRQGRWIPRLLEFAKHPGETLLGMGNGLGTDWLHFAQHGASVVVCSPSMEQLGLIRRNFDLRGVPGRFLHAAPNSLPLESASIDVACVSGLLHEVADPRPVVDEVYRVLKPGGKVLAVTPARYDVNYWIRACFPWHRWLRDPLRQAASAEPVRFTARELKDLFDRFAEHRVYKRHLRRYEVPHIWRWLPMPLLERLLGHVLVVKAFKPVSAAMTFQAAA